MQIVLPVGGDCIGSHDGISQRNKGPTVIALGSRFALSRKGQGRSDEMCLDGWRFIAQSGDVSV